MDCGETSPEKFESFHHLRIPNLTLPEAFQSLQHVLFHFLFLFFVLFRAFITICILRNWDTAYSLSLVKHNLELLYLCMGHNDETDKYLMPGKEANKRIFSHNTGGVPLTSSN